MQKLEILFLDHPISYEKTAAIFSEKKNTVVLNLSEMVRKEFEQEPEFGTEIQSHLNRAEIIPDALLQRLVMDQLVQNKGQRILLNGNPKTPEQLAMLQNQLNEGGWETETVWYVSHNNTDYFLEQYLKKPGMEASMEKYDGVEAFKEKGKAQYNERKKAILGLQQSIAPIPWHIVEINNESEIEAKLDNILRIR